MIINIIKSAFICFSMYTTIPMPQVKWAENSIKYVFYVLPICGLALGIFEHLLYMLSLYLNISSILYACLSTALIILFTGGIHLDGYIDTVDAIFCHGDIEKRKQVLSDAHVGAFAVIYSIIYIIILFGSFENMYSKGIVSYFLILPFIISRVFVIFLVILIRPISKKGLLYTLLPKGNKRGLFIYALLLVFIIIFFSYLLVDYKFAIILLLILIIISIILYRYFNKAFTGISGDLAGFSICLYEAMSILFYSVVGFLWI